MARGRHGRRYLAPNLIWQATHGWPQLAMASALHPQNATPADYAGGLPAQFLYVGLLVAPLLVAGFIRLWRDPQLRFIAVTGLGARQAVLRRRGGADRTGRRPTHGSSDLRVKVLG